MNYDYDFAVIGGGSAGYNAARVSAALGRKTAVIDGAERLSGLCILEGCMPSKTLLYSAEILHKARQGRRFGLKIPVAEGNFSAVQARKQRIIDEFAADRIKSLHHGKFDLVQSNAHFVDAHTVALANGHRLTAAAFLIATGSSVAFPPIEGLEAARPWTSEEVLNLRTQPRSVIVLGGGLVGVELAQFLVRMGTKVTVIQRGPHLLKGHTPEAAQVIADALTADGAEILCGAALQKVARGPKGFTVTFAQDGQTRIRRAAHCFNALGRVPNTGRLQLDQAGVKATGPGQVVINRFQQTSVPHIYAAGDCSGPVEIVHVAILQGELAARHAARVKGLKPVDFDLLLSVVFTDPQLATIGIPEQKLQAENVPYLSASYPFDDHGKSILMEAKRGFVKVLAEPSTGRILGAEIVGPDAGELIHIFTGPLTMRATVHDLLRAPFYHPTLAEIVTYPLEELADKLSKSAKSTRRS
jgi:pyruvate/2-oxoglutarate dehydrogenase complex dihydrolipoamide dehydrogenase (E3) component